MPAGYWVRRREVVMGSSSAQGILALPDRARGIVIVVDGECGAIHDPRNVKLAAALHVRGFATLLLQCSALPDARARHGEASISYLRDCLIETIEWLARQPEASALPIGLYGAGIGSAVVLRVAADLPDRVRAIVFRDGAPQLADREIGHVRPPTLIIVGSHDHAGLTRCKAAYRRLTNLKQLEIVPGAAHALSAKRDLERLIGATTQWFNLYLISRSAVAASAAGRRQDATAGR